VVQEQQLGTAHAVQQAEAALGGFAGDVLILYGDTPLVEAETMANMLARLNAPMLRRSSWWVSAFRSNGLRAHPRTR
jgi:bifunctional N-acetylglucosamine-1-phosphate-uridyltransferase/glucosamine-1-phosphate-acetyltransferase GlmU-like protein